MKPSPPILTSWVVLLSMVSASIASSGPVAPPTAPAAVPLTAAPRSTGIAVSQPVPRRAQTILIPGALADPNTLEQLAEDLRVMGRILDKTIPRTGSGMQPIMDGVYGYAPDPFIMPGHKSVLGQYFGTNDAITRAMYIQGYGVLFTLNVYFPLKPPAQAHSEPVVAEGVDPVWADAQKDLSEPQRPPTYSADPPYVAGQVDDLKRRARSALCHASNIRGLDPDEYITLVIRGLGPPSQGLGPVIPTLTLRTRKRDVDACASRRMSMKDFVGGVEVVEF